MTVPCPHTPPHPHDLRPCEPCSHCNAPAGVWCAPRCPRKLERTGVSHGNAGPERWPAEWFRRPAAAEAPAVVTFRTADGVELGSVVADVLEEHLCGGGAGGGGGESR
jgi:hypothetical protein